MGWRGGAVGRALDLQSTGHGFKFYLWQKLCNSLEFSERMNSTLHNEAIPVSPDIMVLLLELYPKLWTLLIFGLFCHTHCAVNLVGPSQVDDSDCPPLFTTRHVERAICNSWASCYKSPHGAGVPLSCLIHPLSIDFLIFCCFLIFLFFFSCLLYLFSSFVHPSHSTRIVTTLFPRRRS